MTTESQSLDGRIAGFIAAVSAWMLGAIALGWPSWFNGSPFVYYDTEAYLVGGQAILERLTGLRLAGMTVTPGEAQGALLNGGRSPVYGVALRLLLDGGVLESAAWVSAALGAWLVSACVRALRIRRRLLAYGGIIVGLAAASSLPFYAGFLMPDVLTGYLVVALGLLAAGDRLGRIERVGLVALAGFAVAAHGSNLLLLPVAWAILAALGLWSGLERRALGRRAAWLAAPLALALGLNAAGAWAVRQAAGEAPLRPPFLMARVLADGPGRDFLEGACRDEARFELCRHMAKPLDDTVAILWSSDPAVGVFSTSGPAARRRLVAEERAFVAGAVLAHPLRQVKASVRNSLKQLTAFGVGADLNLMRPAVDEMGLARKLPAAGMMLTESRAYLGRFPFRTFDLAQSAAVAAALAALAWRCLLPDMTAAALGHGTGEGARERRVLLGLTAGLLLVLVANAVICGTLSAPASRYQARLIWLLPLWAALLILRLGFRAGRPGARSSGGGSGANDGARTRDLRRDRPAL